jgi:hypothetical protein
LFSVLGVTIKELNFNVIHAARDFLAKKILIYIRKQQDILGRVSHSSVLKVAM